MMPISAVTGGLFMRRPYRRPESQAIVRAWRCRGCPDARFAHAECGGSVYSEGQRIGGRSMESMTGQLLVATPTLKDPNFDRTVVLLVAHEPGGALGVVLNRATQGAVSDVPGPWG